MGQFLNPGNDAFRQIRKAQIYVDKSGLINYMNQVEDTPQKYICNSRPRRFGKSYTADMLTAYYSKDCDSYELFQDLEIAKSDHFKAFLNRCNVIHLDIQWFLTSVEDPAKVVKTITAYVLNELKQQFPKTEIDSEDSLSYALAKIYNQTGEKFVIIIDEWDVLIRDEYQYPEVQKEYINFLRSLFKGSEPTKFIRLAFLTGILPITKLKTQSALNNFDEFTMLYPGAFAPYIGFTDEEVHRLCLVYHRDYQKVRQWYDGYLLDDYQEYNPRAVIGILQTGKFRSYWSSTGTYESIVPYINLNFDGLKTAMIEMLSGGEVPVNVNTFQNDLVSFKDKDDVLTLLIHMGYLAFHQNTQTAYIPNEEIRLELLNAVRSQKWNAYLEFQQESEQLLDATLDQNEEAVAAGMEKIHNEYASAIQYNQENSLSGVLTLGYLSTLQYYFKPVRELPAGRGFADFVYLPKPEYRDSYPALVVELKWNQSADTAIKQIEEKEYPSSIADYTGNILLVGISYDKKTKKHQCRIEQYQK